MKSKMLGLAFALAVGAAGVTDAQAQGANEQFVPLLVYRTGPFAPSGIPIANGMNDYFNLINDRDGGINGVKLTWEECETAYNNDRGVECYERLKGNGPTGASIVSPFSTGITYALIDKVAADKIPMITLGYGRTDTTDGEVFPWVFPLATNYWNQATAQVEYIAQQEGGLDKLKGKHIVIVYHDSAAGKEPLPTLEKLSDKYGFKFEKFAVAPPGVEQKATWLRVGRQLKPDWVLLWGWGVMNSTAIKEAAAVGYPMDHIVGWWWSGSEADVLPAGKAAAGYKAAAFHGAGTDFKAVQQVLDLVHGKGKGAGPKDKVGEVLYNRGLVNAALTVEAIRTAQGKFGKKPLTGEQVRWGVENLDLTQARIDELGLTGLISPLKLSCADHEGKGSVRIEQWDGEKWSFVSDWIKPMWDVTRPMIEQSAAAYAKEKGITPRDCTKAS